MHTHVKTHTHAHVHTHTHTHTHTSPVCSMCCRKKGKEISGMGSPPEVRRYSKIPMAA